MVRDRTVCLDDEPSDPLRDIRCKSRCAYSDLGMGEMPEHGQTFYGMTPLQPGLRLVLVGEEVSDGINSAPIIPLGRHA